MGRLTGPDFVRGIAIMGMLVVHSTLFHYGRITEIDLDDPPMIVTLIGFLAMWSGLFALVSGFVNVHSSKGRKDPLKGFLLTGSTLIMLGAVYFLFLGPALFDLEGGNHLYSLLDGISEDGKVHDSSLERLFYNTSLTMIGANLIAIAALALVVNRMKFGWKAELMLGAISATVLLISVVRIPLYEIYGEAFESGNVTLTLILNPLVNKNDPLLPYLGFGVFGMLMGYWTHQRGLLRRRLKIAYIIGGSFLIMGIAGIFLLPDTMLRRDLDYTWYSIMLFLFGSFVLILSLGIRFFDLSHIGKRRSRKERTLFVRRFGTLALSIFLVETLLSDLLSKCWDLIVPGWNENMGLTVAFGIFVLIVCGALLWLWEKAGFIFSVEHAISKWHRWLGKGSEKDRFTEILNGPPGKL